MRVAVYPPKGHPVAGVYPDGHEQAGQPVEEPRGFAFRLGRIEEGVHNAPVGHEPVALERFLATLIEQAHEEFPGCEVRVERLVDNGDGTSRWISAEEFDPEQHVPVGAGETRATEVHVSAEQQAGGDS